MLLVVLACAPDPGPPVAAPDAPTAEIGPRELVCPHEPPLHGTLQGPGGASPVAVIAVGAQMWDRWGDLPGVPWSHYRQIAAAIEAAGYTVFTFDKGGTGATGGEATGVDARADEVVAAVACVRANGAVGPLVLIGHSAGGAVVNHAVERTRPAHVLTLNPQAAPTEFAPASVIQSESEANPMWEPTVIPGADHLLFPEPAEAGVSTVDPRALGAIVRVVGSVKGANQGPVLAP
jgi:hypothetical protein